MSIAVPRQFWGAHSGEQSVLPLQFAAAFRLAAAFDIAIATRYPEAKPPLAIGRRVLNVAVQYHSTVIKYTYTAIHQVNCNGIQHTVQH